MSNGIDQNSWMQNLQKSVDEIKESLTKLLTTFNDKEEDIRDNGKDIKQLQEEVNTLKLDKAELKGSFRMLKWIVIFIGLLLGGIEIYLIYKGIK